MGMIAYPAITIWQPWATLIAEGLKPFEFRGWEAPRHHIGKRVAIHAGARPVRKKEVKDLLLRVHRVTWRETGLVRQVDAINVLERVLSAPRTLPLSSIVCLATLGEPIRNEELTAKMGIEWANDSDRKKHSNWGWPLADIERLEPFVPARGAQGWWTWLDTREAA